MVKCFLWICFFTLCSCVSCPPVQGNDYILVDNSVLGKRLIKGFPVPGNFWELEMDLATSYDENRHTHSRARLLFRAYRFFDNSRLLVLQKQIEPSYTLISYTQGLIFPSYYTHIRFLLDKSHEREIAEMSAKIMAKWKEEHPQLARQASRDYKDLLFFFTEPIRGRFYFLLYPDGSVLHKDFSKDGIFPANQVHSRYQWCEPGSPRCSYHPNTFLAVAHALKTLRPVQRPDANTNWEIKDRASIASVLQVAIQLFPALSSIISTNDERAFRIPYVYEQNGDLATIRADVSEFSDPVLSKGFLLKHYRRELDFSLTKGLQSDWVRFEVGGEGKIVYSLRLHKLEEKPKSDD